MNDNVIKFPIENKRLPIDSFITRYESFKKSKKNSGIIPDVLSIEATNILIILLMENLENIGFDTTDQNTINKLALLLESLKAYIYAQNDIEHPMHGLSDKLFYKKNSMIYMKHSVLDEIEKI